MFYVVSVRYIYGNVWLQCKTSECLVSFKLLSLFCMSSFQWLFHHRKLLLSDKNICLATYLCSCDPFVSFSRAVNYIFFHILILHCTVVLVYKIKNNDDLIIFSIYPDFSFHNLSNAHIRDSSIRCLEKNTDVHQQIQTLIVKKKSWSSGLETGQQKINAIADDEWHNLISNWSREPIILV